MDVNDLRDIPGPILWLGCAASQTLRHRGSQQRKGLFTRQPSEEAGEQISSLTPCRQGAWDIYEIKLNVGSVGQANWN